MRINYTVMSPYRLQRLAEDRCDIVVAIAVMVLLFAGLLWLPRGALWYWLIPLGLLWLRWNQVRVRRDAWLREAERTGAGWNGTPRTNRGQGRVRLPDMLQ